MPLRRALGLFSTVVTGLFMLMPGRVMHTIILGS